MNRVNLIRNSFNKAANNYNEYAVLQKEVACQLFNSIDKFNISPKNILDIGCGSGFFTTLLAKKFINSEIIALDFAENMLKKIPVMPNISLICANGEQLPFKDNSFDIVGANLMLQWSDNILNQLQNIYKVLTNKGLFVFSSFGIDTLCELRKSWQKVDNNNHVNIFEDMHNIGDLLLHTGFKKPIVKMEKITLTYQNVKDLLIDLKKIGANSVINRSNKLITKTKLMQMIENYEQFRTKSKIPATYEVIYGIGWKN